MDSNAKGQTSRHKVAANSAWLIGDKIVRLGLNLIVTVWLARHFGPEGFGIWNFALAFVALFGVFAMLGMDGIIVRELVADHDNAPVILGTALGLRAAAALIAASAAIGTALWLRGGFDLATLLVALNAFTLVFQSSQIIEYHFQAEMKARPAVIAANAAFLLVSVARLVMLGVEASIAWFGLSLVAEAAITAALLLAAYRREGGHPRWLFNPTLAWRLLRQSWPLLLSGFAVMAYMRIDQVMLATMVGDNAVGQFSAALRIAEVWYFIPAAIMVAVFPVMIEKRASNRQDYERYVQRLYDVMAWLGLLMAAVVHLTAHLVIPLLYGPHYIEAASILSVQIWAGIAVAMSYVHGRWLLAEGLQHYGLFYTVSGAVVNISLNLFLLPRYGAIGAAWATLVTQLGLLPIQLLLPKARGNFFMMLKSVAAPVHLWRTRASVFQG